MVAKESGEQETKIKRYMHRKVGTYFAKDRYGY